MIRLRIAVVGSGALGCYYGTKLALIGRQDVHFLMRGDVEEIRQFGLRIRGKGKNFHLPTVQHHSSTRSIGPCDLVLIALKTTSNHDLVQLIPPLLHETTMLLTLQNGLGNEEFLAKNFGAQRVLGGLCFVCVNRVSRGILEHYDQGHVVIGEYNRGPQPRTHDLVRKFQQSDVTCAVAENLALEHWRKLVWNIPFNGLAVAAGGIDTSIILSNEQLRSECIGLMEEVILAAGGCGYALPVETAAEQVKRTGLMGAYRPSTLIDFQTGRPLEIEAIWGEPLRMAKVAGVATPRLEKLYEKLKAMNATQAEVMAERERASVR